MVSWPILVPMTGLTGQNTSFAVYADQTLYLRHQNFMLYAVPFDGSDQFRKDSTFSVRAALADNAPSAGLLTVGADIGLQPGSLAGYLVRHYNFQARMDQIGSGSDATSKSDSSFHVRAGLTQQSGLSFESVNYPGYFLEVQNGSVYLRRSDGSTAFAAAATFFPRTGLTGSGTSFTTYADPTVYLRQQNHVLYAQKNDGSTQFAQDASFIPKPGLA